jgi:hypothetical protein
VSRKNASGFGRAAWTALLVVIILADCVSADDRPPIYWTPSTTPIVRQVENTTAVARITDDYVGRLVDIALRGANDGKTWVGRIVRLGLLPGLHVPLTSYMYALNHELGHIVRAREEGNTITLHITGTPWQLAPFDLSGPGEAGLSALGGGFEASSVMKRRTEWQWYKEGAGDLAQMIILLEAGLDAPLYAIGDLNGVTSSDLLDLQRNGDVIRYLRVFSTENDAFDARRPGTSFIATGRAMGLRTWLNIADWTWLSAAYAMAIDYVWQGKDVVPARWITFRGVKLAPGARYTLSPVGPEYTVGSYVRTTTATGRAYFRWTERLRDDHLRGFGLSLELPRVQPLTLTASVDFWRLSSGPRGGRSEVVVERHNWPRKDLWLLGALGAKSEGYLAGFPEKSGAYVNVGLAVRMP